MRNSTKPKTCENGSKPAIPPDKASDLVFWICREPYHRRIPYKLIPDMAPELRLQGLGERAIRTAVESQGFARRVSRRKLFQERGTLSLQQVQELRSRTEIQGQIRTEQGQNREKKRQGESHDRRCGGCGRTGHNKRTCRASRAAPYDSDI